MGGQVVARMLATPALWVQIQTALKGLANTHKPAKKYTKKEIKLDPAE
jgi:hypothetical protein